MHDCGLGIKWGLSIKHRLGKKGGLWDGTRKVKI